MKKFYSIAIITLISMMFSISSMGQVIETADKFEGKKTLETRVELSSNISITFQKIIEKGKSPRYLLFTCITDSYCTVTYDNVSLIFLFDDGTTQKFSTTMDTEAGSGDYFLYFASKFAYEKGKSIFNVFSKKRISAIKLYIFEKDVTNVEKAERFMTDMNTILNSK